jgi:hypothetical protein
MPDGRTLDEHYKALTDQELLKLRAEGGFTAEAEQSLDKEFARRKLTPDEAKRRFAPEWLDKANVGTVGLPSLESGERITAEIVGFDDEETRLSIKVISPDNLPTKTRRGHRAIPLRRIISFEPQPDLMERWPCSDPCRDLSLSNPRFIILTMIFLCMIVGSVPLLLLFASRPWGLQEASIITYTLFEVFLTFARTGTRGGPDLPPYKFTCPAVKPQILCLLWRHLGFLFALFALQTAMLAARPHLPDWWNVKDSRGGTPFDIALMLLCFGLAWTQVLTNRSLLNRAHREFSG